MSFRAAHNPGKQDYAICNEQTPFDTLRYSGCLFISSDDRSEKSLKPLYANNHLRDFSAFGYEMT